MKFKSNAWLILNKAKKTLFYPERSRGTLSLNTLSLSKGSRIRKPIVYAILLLLVFGAFFSTLKFVSPPKKAEATGPSWYNSSWQYRKKITIDHTKVSSDQNNFPVYLDLSSDPDLATHAQADGDDILFTKSDGVTKLDHDLARKSSTDQFSPDGAWCWFQDPRAIHYQGTKNQTYMGWVDRQGNVRINSYNHSNKTMSPAVTLRSALQVDDHASPSILIRPDGRLMVFYSAHNGGIMYYRISTNPEDTSWWQNEQTVPGSTWYSYPNPIQLSGEANKIYLFWRDENLRPVFATTTDSINWSAPATLWDSGEQFAYMKVASNGVDRINFAFTNSHPNNTPNNNVYYAYYQGGSFYKADGTLIKNLAGLPLVPAEVDKVYDSVIGGSNGWIWDIALDGSGYPILVYANFPTVNDHRYRYARWNGSTWLDYEITPAGGYIGLGLIGEAYYSGGVTLDHENPNIVYLSREVSGVFEVEKWTTATGGATWSSQVITSGSSEDNLRPLVPRGHSSDELGLIWMKGSYPTYISYATSLNTQPIAITPPAASIAEAYVRIPTLSSSTDTDIYMYYGNPSASDQSNPNGAWDSNYKMVQHLNNGITSSSTDDGTSNNNNGEKIVSTKPNEIAGKMNKAQDFDGTSDYIETGARMNLAGWNALTVEAWVKYEEAVKVDEYTIASNLSATIASFNIRVEPAGDYIEAYVVKEPNTLVGGSFPDLVLNSNWHHLTMTYDTTNGLKVYLDGIASATSYASAANLDADASGLLYIGRNTSPTDEFKGRLDEVRISNAARLQGWITTEINNEGSPSTFYHAGLEEPLTAPTVTIQAADGITASAVDLHGTITDVGTQNATTRGFKYYQSADCTGTENDRSENGSYGAEAYSLNLTSITSNSVYSYKAYATSPAGTGTSAACQPFTTLAVIPPVIPPVEPTATPSSEELASSSGINSTKVNSSTLPTVSFTIEQDPSTFVTGGTITFDATSSGSNIVKYEWSFGDGEIETSASAKINHKYQTPGRYIVTLTAYDTTGNKNTTAQTIDIKPSIPTISNITAKGTALWFEGKSDPDTIVYLTIHSNPYNIKGLADKDGYWTYYLENATNTLGVGAHTVTAYAAVKLSDNSELKGGESKTYDFNMTFDNGKLKVEMKKTRTWQYISLGLGLLLVIGAGFVLMRRRR